jgi:hypothetical protein
MLRTILTATAIALLATRVPAQMTQYCFPGQSGVIQCPCGNPPSGGGRGCNNFSAFTGGATLNATGLASLSADTILLNATGLNANVNAFFYTGSASIPSGVVHGAGIRCVAGGLKVLYPTPPPSTGSSWLAWLLWLIFGDKGISSSAGAISRPRPFTNDKSVSARSAQLGVPITAGQTRYYFVLYKDPLAAIPCGNTASTVNTTNSGSITWMP